MKINCKNFLSNEKNMADCELELNVLENEKQFILTKENDNYTFEISGQITPREDKKNLTLDFYFMDKYYHFKFKEKDEFRQCFSLISEPKPPEEPPEEVEDLNFGIIRDSFEKITTKSNIKFKKMPEDYLFEKIDNCFKTTEEFYGYFTTMSQSSGFGKSRACQNLSTRVYVVYCCLRPGIHSGYPLRSYLANKLTQNYNSEEHAKRYYISYFNMFIMFLNDNPNMSTDDFYKKFSNSFGEEISSKEHYLKINTNLDDLQEKYVFEEKLIERSNTEKLLVFVFDEARSLTSSENILTEETNPKSNFFSLRDVVTGFKKHNKTFVLFLDTFTNLTNFMPSKYFDPSLRAQKKNSIDPIYLLPNWDIFLEIDAISTPQDSRQFEKICTFGRPLWGSWVKARNSNQKYMKIEESYLIGLAKQKLVGGNNINVKNLTKEQMLAIASSRIGTLQPLLLSTAQDFVSKYLAVCTFANPKEGIFKIDYPSEPILSDVAAEYMNEIILYDNNQTTSGYSLIIENLVTAVNTSMIDQGDKGEIITKLLLLNAFDKSINEITDQISLKYCDYVQVKNFIENLYGSNGIDIIKEQLSNNADKLLNGYVRFNHFIRSKFSKNNLNLVNLLKRCTAVQCSKTEPGVDFVIPIVYSFEKNNFDEISAILVQTKLEATPVNPSTAYLKTIKLTQRNIVGPFLVIYMQLGQKKEPILQALDPVYDFQSIIYSEGISKTVFPRICSKMELELKLFSKAQNTSFLENTDKLIEQEILFSSDNLLN